MVLQCVRWWPCFQWNRIATFGGKKLTECAPILLILSIVLLAAVQRGRIDSVNGGGYGLGGNVRSAIILSATYSAKQNLMRMVIVADKRKALRFVCRSTGGGDGGVASVVEWPAKTSGIFFDLFDAPMASHFWPCQWVEYGVTCNVAQSLNKFQLRSTYDDPKAAYHLITFRHAETKRREVVLVISRLYYFERWQQLIYAIEMYRHFGVDLTVVYVRSVLLTIYRLLQAYEKAGLLMIENWPELPKDQYGFDVNAMLMTNAHAAHNSEALHRFRDATKYIIFGDSDDILVPASGMSFSNEFDNYLSLWPNAATFRFNRHHGCVFYDKNTTRFGDFRLSSLLNSTYESGCDVLRWTKYVAVADRLEGAWIHWGGQKSSRAYNDQRVPCQYNAFRHIREWIDNNDTEASGRWKKQNRTSWPLTQANIKEMQQSFMGVLRRDESLSGMQGNKGEVYMRANFNCFLPGAGNICNRNSCPMPANPVECAVAVGSYKVLQNSEPILIEKQDTTILQDILDCSSVKPPVLYV